MPLSRMTRIAALLLLATSALQAEEFRIETRLYSGAKEPFAATTTLFHRNNVYDYLEPVAGEPSKEAAPLSEVTIFQPAQRRFLVVSGSGKVFTIVGCDEIDAELEKVRPAMRSRARQLENQGDARSQKQGRYFAFLADPEFTVRSVDATGVLLFSSEFLTYRVVTTDARRRAVMDQIHEFNNWQAKLNHLLHGALPPDPRLAVNTTLADRSRIAKEIFLTLETAEQPVQIHAVHRFEPGLRGADLQRIKATQQQQQQSASVSFAEYLRQKAKTDQAANQKAPRRR